MLRFSKHAPWFVFALQCECGSQLLWTVFLSAKPELNMTVLLEMPVKIALVEINLAGCVGEFAFC